jgi:hypothetical protein
LPPRGNGGTIFKMHPEKWRASKQETVMQSMRTVENKSGTSFKRHAFIRNQYKGNGGQPLRLRQQVLDCFVCAVSLRARESSRHGCDVFHDTSSPPRSIPRPSTLPICVPRCGLSPVGGWRFSKLSRRRASRTAAGVLGPPAIGVRFQFPLT